ncbi:MAG: serine/threonine protein kinase [Gemmatimonadota bacterium]|nr:serine/threonine protein kinase [Gemmatimonadota bacterium]
MAAIIPPDLASALPERYELRNVLGRGGMATVYLAYDRKHLREVALKVLRPEIAASLGADRFLKEIQIVARLVHPHILTLHDSGESEGFIYYVMPYIEGGSLRQRLEARRPLTSAGPGALAEWVAPEVDAVLAIAGPVADALSYAHRVGVLHRDIKPENILFAQEHPIVADFGIAKAVSTASGANLTRTGISLGTPGYMSPEQAAGFTDVDERTDVYSLAVVVYEMLVGEIPGRWLMEDSVRAGRFLEAVPKHRARLSVVGSTIEAALVHGLAMRPDQRTPTPAALIDELRGVSPAGRRRYRTDEIDEIVKRAAELEASNPTSTGAMTIGGVEAIAREVGISPALVRSAAASLTPPATLRELAPTPVPTPLHRLIGGPTRLRYDRVVDGELAESDYLLLVDEIRRTMQNVGQVSQLGRSFAWAMSRSGPGAREVEIAVTVRGGRTYITVQENLNNLAGGIWGGIGGGMGGGGMGPILGILIGALSAPAEVIAAVVPAWLTLTYATARTSYHLSVRSRERTLEDLADRLGSMTRELVGQPARTESLRPAF